MGPEPLLFFDSGAGGLPYLAMARDRLPGEHFVYVADRKNYPYGEKPADELRPAVVQAMGLAIRRFRPKLVVVACNTASVVALEALRESFEVPFVGVVPAVKPAARPSASGKPPAAGRIAVVATRRTIAGEYLQRLIQEFAAGIEVVSVAATELVDYAEYGIPPRDLALDVATVRRALEPLLRSQVGTVVLGCTHFVLLERAFRAVLGGGVQLVDSREGVIRRVVSILEQRGLRVRDSAGGTARLWLHGGRVDRERYRLFAAEFWLELMDVPDAEDCEADAVERRVGTP